MSYKETILSPYSSLQLFELVMDIKAYPEFLPWVAAARIISQEGDITYAELVVKFKSFQEKYTSKITTTSLNKIDVEMVEGPFKYLNNHWHFEDLNDSMTNIFFEINFAFENRLLEMLMGSMFDRASHKMMAAFTERAQKVYGC
ncbi:MAG: hypothetical protein RIT35_1325 [Pseudomonadota bacterium]|jgi:coenzyme Q-binding protein COQ10